MEPKCLSKSVAVIIATATPVLLMTGSASLAQEPGTGVDCMVGVAAYPTIQSAVDAPACMTIRVPAGTFRENVIIGRSVTVRGAGPERTTVDASGKLAPVFAISSPPGVRQLCDPPVFIVTLAGMTITGGTGPGATFLQRNGGGISASPGVKLTVENSIVTGNSAYTNGGGISLVMGRLTVVDSVITRNTAYANPQNNPPSPNYIGGGGLRIAGCPSVLIVKNGVIKDNVSFGYGGGILVNVPTPVMMVPAPRRFRGRTGRWSSWAPRSCVTRPPRRTAAVASMAIVRT